MKNSHLAKSNRNQQIRKMLAKGIGQAEVAREFNITPQRLGQLVQKWEWQGLLERNEQGFAIPAKGRGEKAREMKEKKARNFMKKSLA